MASHESTEELLVDVSYAEASRWRKFYLTQEKKILGGTAVALFLIIWELAGNIFQWINPMFMSAPSLIFKAGVEMFRSGEIYNDLYVSGVEFLGGYFSAVAVAVSFFLIIGLFKRGKYIFDPLLNFLKVNPP